MSNQTIDDFDESNFDENTPNLEIAEEIVKDLALDVLYTCYDTEVVCLAAAMEELAERVVLYQEPLCLKHLLLKAHMLLLN